MKPADRIVPLVVPAIAGLFLVATSVFDVLPSLGIFNGKRFLQPFVLLIIFGATLFSPPLRHGLAWQLSRIPRWLANSLALLFMLGLASALRFPHPAYGIVDVTLLGMLVLAMLMVAAARQLAGASFDRLALAATVILGALVALQELMGVLAGWALGVEFSFDHMLVQFAHPRFYNQLQSWSLLLLAALPFVFPRYRRMKLLAICLLGLQWCVLVMSGGRGSFLGLVTALLLVSLLARHSRRGWLPVHLAGVVAGAVFYILILTGHHFAVAQGGSFVEESVGRQIFHTTGRTHLWKMAINDAVADPLLGAGPMRFHCNASPGYPAHPHSFPFRILSEWGVPSLMIVLVVCGFLAWRMLRRLFEDEQCAAQGLELRSLLSASIIAAAVHACLSGVLTMPASQVMAVLVCGWLLGIRNGEPSDGDQPGRHLSRVWPVLTCMAGLVLSASLIAFNTYEVQQMEYRTSVLSQASMGGPRYWQYGRACLYRYP